jgi:transposase-like protein
MPIKALRTSPSHAGRYHRADRKQVLQDLLHSDLSMSDIATKHGVATSTVSNWVVRYLPKAVAKTIKKRCHAIRGAAISNSRSLKKVNVQVVKPIAPQNLRELRAVLTNLEDQMGKVKKMIKGYLHD